MPTVTGKFNASISGIMRVTPDHPFVDKSASPPVIVSLPYEATITNGSFSIVVPQSQNLSGQAGITTEGITYTWAAIRTQTVIKFYLLDGTEYSGPTNQDGSSIWWTGSIKDASSRRLDRVSTTVETPIQEPIHAIAPDSATAVDYSTLVGIQTQQPYLDISLHGLANMLTTIPVYRDRISSKFTIKGAYNASTAYILGDLVSYDGNAYIWRSASSLAGQTPPIPAVDNAYWFVAAVKGAAGGTGAQIVGYNAATWKDSVQAAAREDVRAAIASVSNIDLSGYQLKTEGAPRNNAVFTGTTKRDALTFPASDKTREMPTAQYVEDAIASLVTSGKMPKPWFYARRVFEQPINKSETIILWDNRVLNPLNALDSVTGQLTLPNNADLLIYISLLFETSGALSSNNTRSDFEIFASKFSAGTYSNVGNVLFESDSSSSLVWRSRRQGWLYIPGAIAGDIYAFRTRLGGSGIENTGNSIAPGGAGNNFLLIWQM